MINFSVVIPLYNKADTIARTLESVQAQTYKSFEVVIVDDGSSDGGRAVAMSFIGRIPLRIVAQKNLGVSVARNKGAQESVGRYIAFLDADDEWYPDYLYELSRILVKFPGAKVIGTDYEFTINKKIISGKGSNNIEEIDLFDEWPLRNPVNSSTVAIRRDFFIESGGFNKEFRYYEDAEFLFRLALRTKFHISRRVLCRYNTDALCRATGKGYDPCAYPHWNMAERLIASETAPQSLISCATKDIELRVWGDARRLNVEGIRRLAKAYPSTFRKIKLSKFLVHKVGLIVLYPWVICMSICVRMLVRSKIRIKRV